MKKLTEKFNSISVKAGEEFAVELDSNASTGYLWSLFVTEGSAALVKHDYKAKGHPMAIGGGGTERWIYKAEKEGTISIDAQYSRPWEKTGPARSHKFNIDVK